MNLPRPSAPPTAPPQRAGVVIMILAALTGMTPLATDMYLPAFPAMSGEFNASSSAIQLTLTAYLLGLVLGQLLLGPASDATGRRRLLLWGSGLFALLSLVCAFAPDIPVLVVARVLEGIAGAAGMVLARATVSDWYHGPDAAKRFSVLSVIFVVAPIFAPVIGGLVLQVASWRAIFIVLAAIGLLLTVVVAALLPESLPVERRHGGGVPASFRAMGGLLRQRTFMGYVLTFAFAFGAMFGYIAGSSFVFQEVYGASETSYSLVFAVNAAGTLLAGVVFGALSAKVPLNRMLTAGVLLGLVATAAQIVVSVLGDSSMTTTWIFTFVTMVAMGVTIPSVMTIGQEIGRRALGAAAAVLGSGQFLFAAIASPVVGLLGTGSDRSMAIVMVVGFVCAALSLVLLARPWEGHGEPTHLHSTEPASGAPVPGSAVRGEPA